MASRSSTALSAPHHSRSRPVPRRGHVGSLWWEGLRRGDGYHRSAAMGYSAGNFVSYAKVRTHGKRLSSVVCRVQLIGVQARARRALCGLVSPYQCVRWW